MLTHIHIRDLAVVESLQMDLGEGMTVLTGETGAGKSILVDALGLALGDRTDSSVIRAGCERAEIHAGFDVQETVAQWLRDRALDSGRECIVQRVIAKGGRSKGFVNGRPVPVSLLQELGEALVDIHGQHAHQALRRRDYQRLLLDDFGEHQALLSELGDIYGRWKALSDRLDRQEREDQDRDARHELLAYQIRELEALGMHPGEPDELDEEHKRLANTGRLEETTRQAIEQLYEREQGSAHSLLSRATDDLRRLSSIDAGLGNALELLNGALIQVDESVAALRSYLDALELDPQHLESVEQRIADIRDLARKHRIEPDRLPQYLCDLIEEREQLENADMALEQMRQELERLRSAYIDCEARLSSARNSAAAALQEKVAAILTQLDMRHVSFGVSLDSEDGRLSPFGLERVEFLVNTNPGQVPQPIVKVASGGELSRIGLAIQVATARHLLIPTLIFDEVDAGIGGRVAEIVGKLLRALGQTRQVLCVTHLPQVAAQGHNHVRVAKRVSKSGGKGATRTDIRILENDARTSEIARMLGGVQLTEQTRAHAEEMLQMAQQAGRDAAVD